MKLWSSPTAAATARVAICDSPEDLSTFHDPGTAAAIWRRQPLPAFRSWIDALPEDQLPRARLILRPGDVRDAVAHAIAVAGVPAAPQREVWADDIAALAVIFAGLTQARFLRLRFDRITTNACRKFHVDAVTARLVCTYRGTGTQYGEGQRGEAPARVFTVPVAAPILLYGTRSRGRGGLVHRSPPIEGTGEVRSVLVLDPVDDPEDEA